MAISDSDRMRIMMYLAYGGFYYRVIAARIWGKGDPTYVPSTAEVSRVGKVARDANLSSRDWRKGESDSAKTLLNRIGRARAGSNPKLRLAV